MYAEGHAPLEVIGDHDDAFNRVWRAIEKYGKDLHVAGLRSRWVVTVTADAHIKGLVRTLPARLLAAQDEPGADAGWRRPRLPEMLDDLDLNGAYPCAGEPVGQVRLRHPGWSGTAGADAISLWIGQVLARQADVPVKLAAHPSAQKHAFIWATIGSDYGTQLDLEDRGQPLPTSAPVLPAGVTHIWVAGTMSSQGCLAWFPDRGWWRVPMPAFSKCDSTTDASAV